MEFASEMIVKASLARLKIAEVPITLSSDGRHRAPHLRRWRDGWRHLRFTVVGAQIAFFGLFALALARKMPLRVAQGFPEMLLRMVSHNRAVIFGVCLVIAGFAGALYAILQWRHVSFGALIPSEMVRITIPSVTTLAIGAQILFVSFLPGFFEIE